MPGTTRTTCTSRLNQVYGNAQYGIYIDSTSDLAQLTGNTVYGAVVLRDLWPWVPTRTVSGNTVYNNQIGIYANWCRLVGPPDYGVG